LRQSRGPQLSWRKDTPHVDRPGEYLFTASKA
jgi:hypothetical protein